MSCYHPMQQWLPCAWPGCTDGHGEETLSAEEIHGEGEAQNPRVATYRRERVELMDGGVLYHWVPEAEGT